MTTIVFEGRTPTPHTIAVGMQGEHNAETIALEGLPEYGTPVLNVVLPDGTGDVLSITDGTVTLTRNHTPEGGTLTAWVTETDGNDLTWKSEKFYMAIGNLPEIEGPVEQRYPDFVEEAISDVTALVQDAVAAKDAVFGMSATATTLDPGSSATASYSQGTLTIGVPKGADGTTPSFSIGTVQSGDTPSATVTGTDANPVLNLTLPKGDQGDPGDPPTFSIGTVTTGNPGTEADVQISGYGDEYSLSFTIPRGNVGQTGATGATPNLTIGTVQSGSTAAATITGTAESPVLNLTLPKGDQGDPGAGNVSEVRGEKGLTGTVTSSGALKANLKSETKFFNASLAPEEVKTRVYPVSLDSNGKMVVSVPYPYIEAGTGLTWAAQSGTITQISNMSGDYEYAEDATTKTFSLASSGASAGTYGPSQDVTGSNGAAINIPNITVDQYGRVTSINNKVLTCVDTQGGVPDGGTTGQVLKKNSNTDGDVTWGSVDALPSGGTAGQVLQKNSGNTAAEWGGYSVPTGGNTDQVLAKSSNSNGALTWKTISSVPPNYVGINAFLNGDSSNPAWDYLLKSIEFYEFYADSQYSQCYTPHTPQSEYFYYAYTQGRPVALFNLREEDPDYDSNYEHPYIVTFVGTDSENYNILDCECTFNDGIKKIKRFRFINEPATGEEVMEDITPTDYITRTLPITQADYNALVSAGTVDPHTLYCIKETV